MIIMKKIGCILLFLLLLVGTVSAKEPIAFPGSGTEDDPYRISSAEDLTALSKTVADGEDFRGRHFALMNDIALNESEAYYRWESDPPKNSFTPIGSTYCGFAGHFHGGGHTVSGLFIGKEKAYSGLFGYLMGSVDHLTVTGMVTGYYNSALVAGFCDEATVSFVSASGIVTGNDYIGGVVGQQYGSRLENASAKVDVTAKGYSGGVVGYCYRSVIRNACSSGDVIGTRGVGGVTGVAEGADIKNTYSLGEVTGDTYVGGVCGYADEDTKLRYSFSAGDITCDSVGGGVAGVALGSVSDSYSRGKVDGSATGGVIGYMAFPDKEEEYDAKVKNCLYVEDRAACGVAYVPDEDADDADVEGVKLSRLSDAFIKSYLLTGTYVDESLRAEDEDAVWVFGRKNAPQLFFETVSLTVPSFAPAQKVPRTLVLTIGSRTAEVFGETVENDVAPVIRADRTMLPARFVAESLGGTIEWNESERKVTVKKGDMTLVITIGSPRAERNGESLLLEAPAFIEDGRTYLPVRLLAESLGAEVTWNEETNEVTITE